MTNLLNGQLKIILDCGTDDFFAGVNQAFHEKLVAHEIPHDYSTRHLEIIIGIFGVNPSKFTSSFLMIFLTKISN